MEEGLTLEQLLQQGAKPIQQGLTEEQLKSQGATIENQDMLNYMTGQQPAIPEGGHFLERLKLSFTDPEKIKELEQRIGTRGKTEWGDVADLVGATPEFIGGLIGGVAGAGAGGIGAVPGAAIGIGAGVAVRQSIGAIIKQWEEGKIEQQEVAKRLFVKPIISTATAFVGGKIFQKVGGYIASRFPKFLGILSGESPETIKIALNNPQQADNALKGGDTVLRNAVTKTGETAIKLRDAFYTAHKMAKQVLFSKIGKDKLVNRNDLWNEFYKILKDKNVKIITDPSKPGLDFSISSIKANPGEITKINAVYEALTQWKDFSIQGADKFRQLVGMLTKFATETGGTSKSPILGTYYHSINNLIKNNLDDTSKKAYEEINNKFSSQIDLYDDLVDAFNSGEVFTRIANALGENKDSLRMLLNFYKEKTGQDVLSIVAGRKLGAERQAAFGLLNPREWIDLVWSPSSQMRFVIGLGKIGKKTTGMGEYIFPTGARSYFTGEGIKNLLFPETLQ